MVLQYVDSHGRITRSLAADLCQVEGREARAVLERLVKRGDLEVRGERRGSYYARPGRRSRPSYERALDLVQKL
jgi:ATP-dependent DNA helicase RecG